MYVFLSSEDLAKEDRQTPENISSTSTTPTTNGSTTSSSSSLASTENSSNGADSDSASDRKWQFFRQQSRNKEASGSRAVQNLMDHEIFVSIQGNQFRRNGMGDFGTFFC